MDDDREANQAMMRGGTSREEQCSLRGCEGGKAVDLLAVVSHWIGDNDRVRSTIVKRREVR